MGSVLILLPACCILDGAMTEDQLTKILNQQLAQFFGQMSRHIDERFSAVNVRFDEVDQKFSQLQSAVDGIASDVTDMKDELAVRNHQLDRRLDQHERYITQLADYSQVKLEPQS